MGTSTMCMENEPAAACMDGNDDCRSGRLSEWLAVVDWGRRVMKEKWKGKKEW